MYRPELCARPGVSAKPPLLCPSLQSPSGGWELTLQPGFPDPHVYSWASALGLWGTGNRVPSFPDHRRRGKAQGPLPRFRDGQPKHRSPDLSGSPNI
jgi:hypothetical protein